MKKRTIAKVTTAALLLGAIGGIGLFTLLNNNNASATNSTKTSTLNVYEE